VEEAWSRIASNIALKTLESEQSPLHASLGRVLASPVVSPRDVPSRARSAVDGYALRSIDTRGASSTSPRELRVIGDLRIEMDTKPIRIDPGDAIHVATGSGIPNGADAVVMVEYTEQLGDDRVKVYHTVPVGANIIPRGGDIKVNHVVLDAGRVLQPPDLGVLKTLGVTDVKVVRRPKVATLAIGDELTDKMGELEPGEIRESNRIVLGAYVRKYGGEWIDLGIAKDNKADIRAKIEKGIEISDMVCTTGGTSVGQRDFSVEVAGDLGKVLFHGVSMAPGMPFAVTSVKGKPLLSLAGFSVSAIAEFMTFGVPLLRKMLGVSSEWIHPVQEATLTRAIPSRIGRQNFVRLHLYRKQGDPKIYAEPIRVKGSSILSSMVRANAYLIIKPGEEGYPADMQIRARVLSPIEELE
ncbi:MAG: molybdopterin molybdotransferase MoeA, partial [Candidatus Ranarchaeia archaeon]